MSEKYSVIVDGVRSPIGLKNGKMVGILPDDLSAQVINKLMERNANVDPNLIEDLILGCAFPEGPQGMLMARGVEILAGLPVQSAAKVVNRFCGSSMDSVHQVSQAIIAGDMEAGIAAGVEDMFSVPMGGFNPSFNPELYEKEYYMGMGETAENLANELKISLSTVYKTLSTLEDLALAEVDRYEISPEGKKIKLYRSRIGKVEIILDDLEPTLSLHPNLTNSKSIS